MKSYIPWILGGLLLSGPAQAQSDQSQLARPAGAAELNSNLSRLASNPRDVSALIGAGEAALALDDPRAAAGFFARADAIQSGNGRIKAGLARVMLKLQNAPEALRLFDQAQRLGYPDTTILSDRGLAKDMAGDQAGAQRDYRDALQRAPDDEVVIRRYASSLGISGQVDAAEKILQPLLYKSDRTAWRYRAFILAMNNRQADAKRLADQTLPAALASAIVPYMEKMPYLTAAQKAAALHFGQFPTQIGTSIVDIIATPPAPGVATAQAKAPTVVATAPQTARPTREERRNRRAGRVESGRGALLARADAAASVTQAPVRQQGEAVTRPLATAPTPTPTPTPKAVAPSTPAMVQPITRQPSPAGVAPGTVQGAPAPTRPQVQMVQSVPTTASASAGRAPQTSAPPAPRQTPPSAVAGKGAVQGPPAPGFESIDPRPATGVTMAASQPTPTSIVPASVPAAPPSSAPAPSSSVGPSPTATAPTPQPDPIATRTLSDIIRAIDVPEAERRSNVVAVDLAEVQALQAARRAERQAVADKEKKAAAAKVKAAADAKAKKEAEAKALLAANPSRSWLQIATGASKSALAFTLKRLRTKYDAIAPQDAWVAAWGRTNRLVIGPFSSFARAKTLETKLKGDGADVFAWQSDAGEVVERLGGQ